MTKWINADEATKLLGLGKNTIFKMYKKNGIRSKIQPGNRGHPRRMFSEDDCITLLDAGYNPKDAKLRTSQYLTEEHPWVNYNLKPNARPQLTPHQAVMARLKAKQAIKDGIPVREVPSVDLSIFENVP